jgi:hypothetical protein
MTRRRTRAQCLRVASPAERSEATALWRESWRVARERFPTFEAARAAGYDFSIKPFDEQIAGGSGLLHLTSRDAMRDRRVLDVERPESLVYQVLPDGKVSLAALLFRARSSKPPPPRGGEIVKWHAHASAGRLGRTIMPTPGSQRACGPLSRTKLPSRPSRMRAWPERASTAGGAPESAG